MAELIFRGLDILIRVAKFGDPLAPPKKEIKYFNRNSQKWQDYLRLTRQKICYFVEIISSLQL